VAVWDVADELYVLLTGADLFDGVVANGLLEPLLEEAAADWAAGVVDENNEVDDDAADELAGLGAKAAELKLSAGVAPNPTLPAKGFFTTAALSSLEASHDRLATFFCFGCSDVEGGGSCFLSSSSDWSSSFSSRLARLSKSSFFSCMSIPASPPCLFRLIF
jgi:hypothetical protein